MSLQKSIILRSLIFIIFVTIILYSLWSNTMHKEKTLNSFLEYIDQAKLENLKLTIYYKSLFIFTHTPLTDNELIREDYEYKMTINGHRLKEYISLFDRIKSTTLIHVENNTYLNSRLYYQFETEKGQKVLTVSMWDKFNSIFVNGIEYNENEQFCNIIMPFLPKDAAQELSEYLQLIYHYSIKS